jgi:hypothetical protein
MGTVNLHRYLHDRDVLHFLTFSTRKISSSKTFIAAFIVSYHYHMIMNFIIKENYSYNILTSIKSRCIHMLMIIWYYCETRHSVDPFE